VTERLQTPAGPPRPGQPAWNTQRGSAMPVGRYRRTGPPLTVDPAERRWPANRVEHAPLWCSVDLRDGNQSLPRPMGLDRKQVFFDLLVRMGFKEIEVGYPSASEADFAFVRQLITGGHIPDDVTIAVFTPARPELIDRTFDAIDGAERALVHLCSATAPVWRDVVYSMSRAEVKALAVDATAHILRRARSRPRSRLRLQYSPETFNVTELEFALEVCDAVVARWGADPADPVVLNLPATVETESPNVFADQIEWMHRRLAHRDAVVLSVHPHNDRGTGVAAAELALAAGAQRVEGTLFGSGERTGNVCLVTLGLNLLTRGVDPQLDFSDIDAVRRVVEHCNQIAVPDRHPYGGSLVYTAFSGTHQDAIKKGLAALERAAAAAGTGAGELPWRVPYLPLDPADVGRTYEGVVRVNSQSGKGGPAYLLQANYGLNLPRAVQTELARLVQQTTDATGAELTAPELWALFRDAFLHPRETLRLKHLHVDRAADGRARVAADLLLDTGRTVECHGTGDDPAAAFGAALRAAGYPVRPAHVESHAVSGPVAPATAAAYAAVDVGGTMFWGAGLAESGADAAAYAVLAAVNRSLATAPHLAEHD
jgi:2-isopropylmalate synthase